MKRPPTPMRHVVLVVLLAACAAPAAARQRDEVEDLGERLRQRYSVVAVEDGVGLVPRQSGDVRIVEVRDGAVLVDGEAMSGRELRERLGAEGADLILQITYLTADDQQELVGAAASSPAPPAPSGDGAAEPRDRRRSGDVSRVMGDVRVARDERVEGDVAAVMGSAYIDGQVDGDVSVVMGDLNLGPEAVVEGDVHIVGGTLNRAEGARVEGRIDNVAVGSGSWSGSDFPAMFAETLGRRLGSLVGTLVRVALLALLALVVVAAGRTSVERIADRTAADPMRAGLIGFGAQLLFIPLLVITIVVLVVSIIGIPLLLLVPFALLLLLVVLLVGYTGVAYHVGRFLTGRFGWEGRGPHATVILGVIAIALVTVLARSAAVLAGGLFTFPLSAIGFVVEYVAWTLGLGAAILAWVQQRRRTPPPLPAP